MTDKFDRLLRLAHGRSIVVWGAGIDGEAFVEHYKNHSQLIKYIIDNDREKERGHIGSISIIHPSSVIEWEDLFVVVASSKYEYDIITELREIGLKGDVDYTTWDPVNKEIMFESVETDDVITVLKGIIPRSESHRVNNQTEFGRYKKEAEEKNSIKEAVKSVLCGRGGYVGWCDVCCRLVRFKTYRSTFSKEFSFRESLVCPSCGMNARMRQVYRYLKSLGVDGAVYAYEYVTPAYKAYKGIYSSIIGSEYCGDDCVGGQIYDGIRHENAMCLSFDDNTYDLMISCDVFEHVSDYKKAFLESFRCLKTGGQLVFTVPFQHEQYETVVRAEIGEGGIVYLLPPEYHGDPMSEEGSLCFYNYGWSLLDTIREIGFSDVYALYEYDMEAALLSETPLFVAYK